MSGDDRPDLDREEWVARTLRRPVRDAKLPPFSEIETRLGRPPSRDGAVLAVVLVVVLALIVGNALAARRLQVGQPGASFTIVPASSTAARTASVAITAIPTTRAALPVAPERPAALVVAPNGDLYIADLQRDQILALTPSGTFRVVAGNGKRGFSGDGGRAGDAEIDAPGGMAFGPDGVLYFADQGNARVRAVTPDGRISTIAGSGRRGWVDDGTRALEASLSPTDVTFGPEALLYVASDREVLRLDADHTFTRVAGTDAPYGGLYGLGGPAIDASVDGPTGIAFDSAGDLYIAGFATKDLLVVTTNGIMTAPLRTHSFYPRGVGGLASAPDGSVLAMDGLSLAHLTPKGEENLYSFDPGSFLGIKGFQPDGIAIGNDGTVYVDTFRGNGYADRTAIAALSPAGTRSRILWQASPP